MLSSLYGLSITSAAACKKSLAWKTVTEFQHFYAVAVGWLPCYETLRPASPRTGACASMGTALLGHTRGPFSPALCLSVVSNRCLGEKEKYIDCFPPVLFQCLARSRWLGR